MALENAAAPSQEDLDESQTALRLDYTLETKEERNSLVKKIIENTPEERLTPKYLEILADYIVFAMDKEEKKEKRILTSNRLITVNKRETSYQGLVAKLENGEDGIYNLTSDLGKNVLFASRNAITEDDIENIPGLKELREEIVKIEEREKAARGKEKYLLKKQLIQMRQDQYVLKSSAQPSMHVVNVFRNFNYIDFNENITVAEDGTVTSDGIVSFFNPKHISALLCNYSKLKEDAWGEFGGDGYYMMLDLDNLVDAALKEEYPLYYDLLIYKIDGRPNTEIQALLAEKYGFAHTVEYISCLWRNKIPKILATKAQDDYLTWYYSTQEYGKWKRCGRCGQIKLAHPRFFSKNPCSPTGLYSICKKCRNTKKGVKQVGRGS